MLRSRSSCYHFLFGRGLIIGAQSDDPRMRFDNLAGGSMELPASIGREAKVLNGSRANTAIPAAIPAVTLWSLCRFQ